MAEPLDHLLDIASLDDDQIHSILDTAGQIRSAPHRFRGLADGRLLINLFYEPSTRTRCSFEIAARRLGMDVVNFSTSGSSVSKGETLLDSFRTLAAMAPDIVVLRHPEDGAAAELAAAAPAGLSLVNAGDGCRAHPSQALLDAFTLKQHFGDLGGISVLIAGDLRHSRVTRSDVEIFRRLGVGEIRLAAPPQLRPGAETARGTRLFDDIDSAIAGVDVVMMLRIQHERQADTLSSPQEYHRDWGLNAERLRRAAPGCRVMHPGPMNRGVEIASEVADGPGSLILEQVANGIFVRMAVLLALLDAGPSATAEPGA
jgi:aspartate carbamoyltransferase catalytic subunit